MGINGKASFRMIRSISRSARRGLRVLAADVRGSTSAMMAAAFVPVLLALGGGIDLGRAYIVKSQMQTAVDAAALAAAQSCKTKIVGSNPGTTQADTTDAVPQATAYFNDNFVDTYMGTTGRTLTQNEMCTGDNFMRVRLTAAATMPYTFMRIAGLQNTAITATATAETSSTPATIEAVMVLDVTGSMTAALGSTTRIAALKDAAKDFVDVLYASRETQNKASIALGIVPYNITVNVGKKFGSTAVLGNTVSNLAGFTDRSDFLGWGGCIKDDTTIQNMSSDINVQDAGAWDIRKDVPGFDGTSAPKIDPFLYPPSWIKKNLSASVSSATSDYYKEAGLSTGPSFQDGRYKFTAVVTTNDTIASSAAYRGFFWDTYSGLNNGSGTNANDDVIVALDGSYYNPTATGNGKTATNWKVNTARIPYYDTASEFPLATAYGVSNLTANSPNQQCPAEMMQIAYQRSMSDYKDWIDDNIVAMRPGAGTIHHAGALWGYRQLLNTAAFPRTNTTTKAPKRVMLFMTDGNYEFADWSTNATQRSQWADGMYSLYGRINDKKILNSTDPEAVQTASSLRFSKICAAAKKDGAVVYVVALAISDTTSDSMFSTCAPGDKYKKAASAAELRKAFQDIAKEIIDLHIVT